MQTRSERELPTERDRERQRDYHHLLSGPLAWLCAVCRSVAASSTAPPASPSIVAGTCTGVAVVGPTSTTATTRPWPSTCRCCLRWRPSTACSSCCRVGCASACSGASRVPCARVCIGHRTADAPAGNNDPCCSSSCPHCGRVGAGSSAGLGAKRGRSGLVLTKGGRAGALGPSAGGTGR